MADARAPNLGRGRGRTFAPRGGRGGPRGGRNAMELVLQLPRDGGSPIASRLSTLHDANSTTDDTIDTFVQGRSTHHAFHIITVRQKQVENVCGGLNSQIPTNTLALFYTTFIPKSLTEQRRNFLNYNNTLKLQKSDTKTLLQRHTPYNKSLLIHSRWFLSTRSSHLMPTTNLLLNYQRTRAILSS